jgi:hypothetical protein
MAPCSKTRVTRRVSAYVVWYEESRAPLGMGERFDVSEQLIGSSCAHGITWCRNGRG